jgi:DNA polymerase III gamma/tau subunit
MEIMEEISHFMFTSILNIQGKFKRKEFLSSAKSIEEIKEIEDFLEKIKEDLQKETSRDTVNNFFILSGISGKNRRWYLGWGVIIAKKVKNVVKDEKGKYQPQVDKNEREQLYIVWGITPSYPSRGKTGINENKIKQHKDAVEILKNMGKGPDDVFKYRPILIEDAELEKIKKGDIKIVLDKLSENKEIFGEVKKDIAALKEDFATFIQKYYKKHNEKQSDEDNNPEQPKENNNMQGDKLNSIIHALSTKPFLILAGVSGTGKTQIARIVAGVMAGEEKKEKNNEIPPAPLIKGGQRGDLKEVSD